MKKEEFKRLGQQLKPDQSLESKIKKAVQQYEQPKKRNQKPFYLLTSVAACFTLLIGGYVFISNQQNNQSQQAIIGLDNRAPTQDGVYLPPIQLPQLQDGMMVDMIGLIVYKGKIYTQTSTTITKEAALRLKGEKIGRTINNINEWSKQNEYAKEFASTIGEVDVYKVKGYDDSFRIMASDDNGTYFYECLNDITIKDGADLLSRLNIAGNIQATNYEDYDSWNSEKKSYKPVSDLAAVETFITTLNNAKAYRREDVQGLYDNVNQHFITLTLKDGTNVEFRLFQEKYVTYGFADVVFELDTEQLIPFWK